MHRPELQDKTVLVSCHGCATREILNIASGVLGWLIPGMAAACEKLQSVALIRCGKWTAFSDL